MPEPSDPLPPLPYSTVGDPSPAEWQQVRQAADQLRAAADLITTTATAGGTGLVTVNGAALAEWLNAAADDATQIGPDPHAVHMAQAILTTGGDPG